MLSKGRISGVSKGRISGVEYLGADKVATEEAGSGSFLLAHDPTTGQTVVDQTVLHGLKSINQSISFRVLLKTTTV